jgi:bacterioferritin
MDKTQVVAKLNEILKWEYAGLVQYTQFSFLVQGFWREVYSKFFRKNGEEALGHAQQVGTKIVALGGVPTVERAEVRISDDLQAMLQYSLEIERHHAQLYNEALALVGDADLGLRVLLEDIGREEQEGAEHLEKLLNQKELAVSATETRSKAAG